MNQIHSSPTNPALTTQDPLPLQVVPGGTKNKARKWVNPPGGDQAQPACFGVSRLQIPERSKSDRLCSTCMSLGSLNSTHWEGINNFRRVIVDHHHTFDAIFKSAREGCHLCVLLLMAWEEIRRLEKDPGGGWVSKSGLDSNYLNDGIRLRFERFEMKDQLTGVVVDRVLITVLCGEFLGGRLICQTMDNNHRVLPETCLPSGSDTNTGSSASLSRIKAWLDICLSSHPACSQTDSQPPPLPTRVIAVGQKGDSRCYLVSGSERSGYYATLSHRWGDTHSRPLSTTDQTLSCRQRGIEDKALPKTFRHAVQVCRELGIEYIWIDSLCIIQEQETQEDWAKEAPRMGTVYGNSMLNISAAVAADSTQGCFKERLGLTVWPCPIVLFGRACHVTRRPAYELQCFGDFGDGAQNDSNVLARRAWVLQEQVLSRRSIIFSKNGLIWRCATLSTNEKYPLGIPHTPLKSVESFDNHRLLHCIVNRITPPTPKVPMVDTYARWYTTVQEFTKRNLTYEKDRLAAIAGIAKRFGVAVNDSYHAGLWRHDMIFGLLWYAEPITGTYIVNPAMAPSWSWASVVGGVNYEGLRPAHADAHRTLSLPVIDILDVSDPTTCEDHPFGVTSKASLSLSGVLLRVKRDEHEESRLALVDNGLQFAGNLRQKLSPDVPDDHGSYRGPLFCLPIWVVHLPYDRSVLADTEVYQASWKRSLESGKGGHEGYVRAYCLILQAIEGIQNTYRRIGRWDLYKDVAREISRTALFGERRSITLI